MSVAEMGVSLFAANEGFLDDVEVDKVLAFEAALLAYMHEDHGDLHEADQRDRRYNDDIVEASHEKARSSAFKEYAHLVIETASEGQQHGAARKSARDRQRARTRRRSPRPWRWWRRAKMRKAQDRMAASAALRGEDPQVIGHLAKANVEYRPFS